MTHERLRLAREQKGWTIDELSRRSGLRSRTIELIDRGQLAELPAGLYCRSSIRSYAVAVGLNPEDVLEALGPMLPSAEDPLDGLARRCGHSRKAEVRRPEPPASIQPGAPAVSANLVTAASGLAAGDDPTEIRLGLCASTEDATSQPPRARLTFDSGHHWWRPLAASAIDSVLLASMGGALVWLTAIACATSVPVALRIAGPGMAVVFALIVALYFVLFGGVGNGTPGVSLMHLDVPPAGRVVLNPRDVFGRARRSIFHDTSLMAGH